MSIKAHNWFIDVSLTISQPSETLTIMCYINSRSWCRTAH